MSFQFNPTDGYRNVTSFPTKPANETQFRADMMTLLDQLRDYLNGAGDIAIKSADNNFLVSQTINGNVTANGSAGSDPNFIMAFAGLFRGLLRYVGAVGELQLQNYNLGGALTAELALTNSGELLFNRNEVWDNGNAPMHVGSNDYLQLPNGFIIQWAYANIPSAGGVMTFPIAFPTLTLGVFANLDSNVGNANAFSWNTSAANIAQTSGVTKGVSMIAIGR